MKIAKNPSDFEKLINENHFRVTIFGSARIKKTDPRYQMIFNLSKMIGEKGIDIVTGGGPGIMEAANRGHAEGQKKAEKKAHSIGLGIKLPNEQRFSEDIEIRKMFNRFSNRLDNFMLLSNVVVVAPGGVGTLLELFYTWQLIQVKHICHIPIILFGNMYEGLLKWLKKNPLKNKFLKKQDYELLFYAKSADDVMKVINKSYEEYKKGNPKLCVNNKQYKF